MLELRSLLDELGLELVAGARHERTSVRWVHSTELLDPTPWLSGSELILTTGLQLETQDRQRRFVNLLRDHDVAGIGFGTGFGHEEVPDPLVREADRVGLPVFQVPYELPFIAITELASTWLVNQQTEQRMAGAALAEAIGGALGEREIAARLSPFGIGERAAVIVFNCAEREGAERDLDALLGDEGVAALVALREELLCAIVDSRTGGPAPFELAGRLRAALAESHGPVHAAVSRAAPAGQIRHSFNEARCALEAAELANGSAPDVASYKDLGAFQLLLALQDDEALRLYCDSVLAPLENGSGDYGDELIRSVEAFIEQNGQWERAARQLYCHRHTLRYRIKRVEELTGRDLSTARDRIEFWLALRGRELIR